MFVEKGTDKKFDIIPNIKFKIQDVEVDGNPNGAITTYTFPNVNEDHSISAIFVPLNRAIILVHGFNSSNDAWGGLEKPNLKSLLEDNENRIVKYFSYLKNWDTPIEDIVADLNDSLKNKWNTELYIEELGVDIIAHSMGGLIARYLTTYYHEFEFAQHVKKIITLGTPNYGSAWASIPDLFGKMQGEQMFYGSSFLYNLHRLSLINQNNPQVDVKVLSIVGAGDFYLNNNDGVVLIPSANLENLNSTVCYVPKNHISVLTDGIAYITKDDHHSYKPITDFLGNNPIESNVNELKDGGYGLIFIKLQDQNENPVSVRSKYSIGPINLIFTNVFWWPLFSINFNPYKPDFVDIDVNGGLHCVNTESGIYFATNIREGKYTLIIKPEKGFETIQRDVVIKPNQAAAVLYTVDSSKQFAFKNVNQGTITPIAFENTGIEMQFDTNPGGDISVYYFDTTITNNRENFRILPCYWDIVSTMQRDSFSVQIQFNYTDSQIVYNDLNEPGLAIFYLDSIWNIDTTSVLDTASNKITIKTNYFEIYSIIDTTNPVDINSKVVPIPKYLNISSNYPNPFSNRTRFKLQLPKESQVKLMIFNISGEHINTLINDRKNPGYYSVIWDGKDRRGTNVSSGIYFCLLQVNDEVKIKKIQLLRK